jgi:NAD-dependent deacetylase
MSVPRAYEGTRVVVVSGGGLSKASSVPASAQDGRFRGLPITDITTPRMWADDPELVRCWFDERRMALAPVLPNPAHEALARMQHALRAKRCTLVTRNRDGLLQKASAEDVLEMHGSLFRLRCSDHDQHPRVGVFGRQPRGRCCAVCGASLRPDVVLVGEEPQELDRIRAAVRACDVFMTVGASADSPLMRELVALARESDARCIDVNLQPENSELFDEVLAEPAEEAIPRLVGRWLGEE